MNNLYDNLKKCIFAASGIPLLGRIVGRYGVRTNPEKMKAIPDWTLPADVKRLRKFLGLTAYLHNYLRKYAEMAVHLSWLLKNTRNGYVRPIARDLLEASSRILMNRPYW